MPENKPQVVELSATDDLPSTIQKLQLPALPVIILQGCFDAQLTAPVKAICSRVLAPTAADPGALILDNGTCSECAALVGEAAAEQDTPPRLIGIVPADGAASALDVNHTLFLRLPREWSRTNKYLFQIADELARAETPGAQPVTAVLLGGGDAEKDAMIRCVRRGWPIIVIAGTGGLADQIVQALAPAPDGTAGARPSDPELREIVETGTIFRFPLDGNVDDLNRILLARIDVRGAATTLKDAWERFDQLDHAAIRRQNSFRLTELAILLLAVAATLAAILKAGVNVPAWALANAGIVHWFVLLIPITTSAVAAYNSHFREGYKWIQLRGAAEAIKREIFRFRAQAGIYSDAQCVATSRESKLAAKLKDITTALEQSEVNKTSIEAAAKDDPKRMGTLSPDQYVVSRIQDQVNFFSRATKKLSRKLKWMQILIYAAGASGTILAAVYLDVWVALATATVAALTTKLQADQVENTLVQYNQTLTALRNIESWWNALSRWEKSRRSNIDLLVDQTERTLEAETAGWVQQMQSGLDKLTEKEPPVSGQKRSTAAA